MHKRRERNALSHYCAWTGNGSTTLTGQIGFTSYTTKKMPLKKIEHIYDTYVLPYVVMNVPDSSKVVMYGATILWDGSV